MAVEEFVEKMLGLLDKEREAEIQETQTLSERLSSKELERRGVCLRGLQLSSHRSGLYGRMVALFEPEPKHRGKNVKQELPSSNITPGDIVGVGFTNANPTDKPITSGIVLQVSAFSISVAFDESQDILDLDDSASYKLTKLANDVTYRRLKTNLNDLLRYRDGPARRLIDTLFCLEEVSGPGGEFPFKFVNKGLDESQREAVKFALTQREVAVIHGPPGTGKTTTVVEVILQSVAQGLKVLVTAPSNIAVDNLLERLAAAHPSPRLVRLGHPARLMPHLTKFSLDAVVSAAEETNIVRDVRADIHKTLSKMKKARSGGERKALRDELKHLRKEVSQREEKATGEVLARAQVVLSTLTTASLDGPLKHLRDKAFDLVVIDECSQALEAACWIGLLRAGRCVLAGDHLQLPPTIICKEAASAGLELTLMERILSSLVQEKGKDVVRMLTTQYRMHEQIMTWASEQLYQGKLAAHTSVATHLLSELEGVSDTEETRAPLLLIDTAGCDLRELDLPEEVSKGNEGEADVAAAHVQNLIKAGVKPVDIAVIAPYNMQVDLLRDRLCPHHPGLEVKSVDGFQGREKEAVVISMVRSNLTGEIGFLSEKRRINVAVTRARRHLAVICDSETVCGDQFISSLVHYMMDNGDVLSADQVLQDIPVAHSHRPRGPTALTSHKEAQTAASKHKTAPVIPLVPKEDKAVQFRQQLDQFVADRTLTTLDFPASLNSHDRMVIHEVAEQMGLGHCSVGEGKARHIQVTKMIGTDSDRPATLLEEEDTPDAQWLTSSAENSCQNRVVGGADSDTPDNDKVASKVENQQDFKSEAMDEISNPVPRAAFSKESFVSSPEGSSAVSVNDELSTLAAGDEASSSDLDIAKHRTGSANAGFSDAHIGGCRVKEVENTSCQDMSVCRHCQKNVPTTNSFLHELHCSKPSKPLTVSTTDCNRQTDSGTGGGGKGARKKENIRKQEPPAQPAVGKKKEKQKPKLSHVQKASEVLGKIADDDFDALISSITELDGKCAFRKCKTLTTILGQQCSLCDRRFCLAHLTPEIHGCGAAAKELARRTISREGILHSGSGVPDKKPNAARRAQLELRMEKKKDELTKARARQGNKKKS